MPYYFRELRLSPQTECLALGKYAALTAPDTQGGKTAPPLGIHSRIPRGGVNIGTGVTCATKATKSHVKGCNNDAALPHLDAARIGTGVGLAFILELAHIAALLAIVGKGFVVDVVAQIFRDALRVAFIKKFFGCIFEVAGV